LLDPAAHADTAGFEVFRFYSGGGEGPVIAFGYRDGERLLPAPSQIGVERAAALPDRPHLAFHDGEVAALARKLRRVVGRQDDIIRCAPEAKLGRPRRTFLRQKLLRASAIADTRRNARESSGQHLVRDRTPRTVARDGDAQSRR